MNCQQKLVHLSFDYKMYLMLNHHVQHISVEAWTFRHLFLHSQTGSQQLLTADCIAVLVAC